MGKKIITAIVGVCLLATLVSCVQTRGNTFTWSNDEYLIHKVYPSDFGIAIVSCTRKRPPNDDFVTIKIGTDGTMLWKLETDQIPQALGDILYAYDEKKGTTSIFNKDTGTLINTVNGRVFSDSFDKAGFYLSYVKYPNAEAGKQSDSNKKRPKATLVKLDLHGSTVWKATLSNADRIKNISLDSEEIIVVCDIPQTDENADPSSIIWYGYTELGDRQNTSKDHTYCCWDEASKPRPVISVFYLDRKTGKLKKRLDLEAKGNYNTNLLNNNLAMFINDVAGTRFVNLGKGTVKPIKNEYPIQFSCFDGKVLALPDTLYSETNEMFCLDYDDAKTLWSRRVNENSIRDAFILRDCILVYSNLDSNWQNPNRKVEALDKDTGETIWEKECSAIETSPENQIKTFTIQKPDGSSNQCIIIKNKSYRNIYSLIDIKTGNNIFTVEVPKSKTVLGVKMFGNKLYMVYQDSIVEFDAITAQTRTLKVWQRVFDKFLKSDALMPQQKINEIKTKTFIFDDVIVFTCDRDTLVFNVKAFETIAFLSNQTFNHVEIADKTIHLWRDGKLKKIAY